MVLYCNRRDDHSSSTTLVTSNPSSEYPSNDTNPQEQEPQPQQEQEQEDATMKVIIFDWDDTLCPSSYFDRHQIDTIDNLPTKFHPLFKEIARCAEKCLQEASKYGEVIIITNSDDGWVKYSCERILPTLLPSLSKYRIVSARTNYETFYPGQPLCWKAAAFAHEVHEYFEDTTITTTSSYCSDAMENDDDYDIEIDTANATATATATTSDICIMNNTNSTSIQAKDKNHHPHRDSDASTATCHDDTFDRPCPSLELSDVSSQDESYDCSMMIENNDSNCNTNRSSTIDKKNSTATTATTSTIVSSSTTSVTSTIAYKQSKTIGNNNNSNEKNSSSNAATKMDQQDGHRRQRCSKDSNHVDFNVCNNDNHRSNKKMKREIISFGDSMEERTAVRIVAEQLDATAKSVMFVQSPTPIELIGQLFMLTNHMKFVCEHDYCLDLEISSEQAQRFAETHLHNKQQHFQQQQQQQQRFQQINNNCNNNNIKVRRSIDIIQLASELSMIVTNKRRAATRNSNRAAVTSTAEIVVVADRNHDHGIDNHNHHHLHHYPNEEMMMETEPLRP